MQNLIKEIVEMDREARAITDAAQQEKVNSEKEISERREQIRKEYLEKARHRLALNEPKERESAEAAWKEKERRQQEIAERLDALYQEKGGEWVKAIVDNVIGA